MKGAVFAMTYTPDDMRDMDWDDPAWDDEEPDLFECEDCGHQWNPSWIPATLEQPGEYRVPECPRCFGAPREERH